jgi:restriction endonuclease S subunit
MALSETLNNTSKTTMTTIAEFTASLLKCRDILRKDGITGMDSMRTICLYILAKFFNIERCKILEVPEHLAWENIMITLRTKNGGVQHSLEYFKSKDEDSIIYHFDKLFNTQELPFNIKSPNVHKEILEIIDRIDFMKFDLHMDVIGFVFEQHLNTGASSSSRDLGQYFTDRSICNYMTELCKPTFKSPGVIESICDPTMGTAGFLTSAVKYFNRLDYSIDWSVQQQQIHGCDLDAKVSGLANVNMFIESNGAKFENIIEHDSLHNDLPQTGYDIILANMPFGIKGLKHADVCERVKALKINGTKSEPLFLQLIMASLNKGGRCAVVVPDGVLINSSNLHNGTREYLLDNFELKKVIKMDGTFFMNTGIKPSILFFENTGLSTGPIEFCEVSKGVDGTVSEKTIITVDRDQLDTAFTLDMRKFIVDDKPKTNTVYPMVKLGDVIEYVRGYAFKSSDFKTDGFPVLKVTNLKNNSISFDKMEYVEENDMYNKYLVKKNDIIIAITGSTGNTSINNTLYDFYLNQNSVSIKSKNENVLQQKYLFYYIIYGNFISFINTKVLGSALPFLSITELILFEIPLPPLEVQQQIVETLDRIYESKESSVKLSDNIKSQMSALVTSMAGRGFNEVKLEDVLEIPKFIRFKSSDMDNKGDIPFYNGSWSSPVGTHSDVSYDSETPYYVFIKDGGGDHNSEKVGMGMFFKVVKKTAIASHNLIFILKEYSETQYKFIYYYTKGNIKNIRDMARYSINLGAISTKSLMDFKIPQPPLEFQQDLVRRLEALDSQLKSLDDLAKSAEDNAKYMLESYLTPAISIQSEPVVEELVTETPKVVEEKPKKKLIRKIKHVE